ncbi:hypothetical protein QOT17_020185 [Balamuthia mandrillaris]
MHKAAMIHGEENNTGQHRGSSSASPNLHGVSLLDRRELRLREWHQCVSNTLHMDRVYRELAYQVDGRRRKILSRFSYLRLEGCQQMQDLMKLIITAPPEDSLLSIFLELQNDKDRNVTAIFLESVLSPTFIAEVSSLSPVSSREKQTALETMQGLLVLHQPSKEYFAQLDGVSSCLKLLHSEQRSFLGVPCLQVLLSAMIGSDATNRLCFEEEDGYLHLLAILKQRKAKFMSHAGQYFKANEKLTKLMGENLWSLIARHTFTQSPSKQCIFALVEAIDEVLLASAAVDSGI